MDTFQRLLFGFARQQDGHGPPAGRRSFSVNLQKDTVQSGAQPSSHNGVQKSLTKAESKTSLSGVRSQGGVSSSRSTIDETPSMAKQARSRTLGGSSVADTNAKRSPSAPLSSRGNFNLTSLTERSPHVPPNEFPKAYGIGAPSSAPPADNRARCLESIPECQNHEGMCDDPSKEVYTTDDEPPSKGVDSSCDGHSLSTPKQETDQQPLNESSNQELPNLLKEDELPEAELDDSTKEDVVIAIMGPTGTGKSSFVAKATNSGDEGVGHALVSHTSEIKAAKCIIEKSSVVLVDTPSFNDTHKSDLQILESISDWLNNTYQQGTLLSGILYFHRISDNRMAGTPLKNLRVFQKLCGDKAMSQVILVTTMWDEVDESIGSERLEELEGSYWKAMIAQGSTTYCYRNTLESSRQLLSQLVERKRREVRLQKQIANKNLGLKETNAGELYSRLDQIAEKRTEVLARITAQRQQLAGDQAMADDLRKQYEALKAELDRRGQQMQSLKSTSVKRPAGYIRKALN